LNVGEIKAFTAKGAKEAAKDARELKNLRGPKLPPPQTCQAQIDLRVDISGA
jgi:hypothetical protein